MSPALARLVDRAIAEEQAEAALDELTEAVRRDPAIPQEDHHRASILLLLETAAFEEARDHLAALEATGARGPWLDALYLAVARRANRPEEQLARLALMERRGTQDFSYILMKWEILQSLRRFDVVARDIDQVERIAPAGAALPRAWMALLRAGLAHNQGRFAASIARLDSLVADPCLPTLVPQAVSSPPRRRTAGRLLRMVDDIVALVRAHGLHVAFTGGALLGLIREDAFLLGDADLDLAVLSPSTADAMERALLGGGLFEAKAAPMDFGDYRVFHHRPTGLILDVMVHARRGGCRRSLWRATDGAALRELAFPDYDMAWIDHAGLGRCVPLPTDPEAHLEALYGAWRVPDATFDTTLSACNLVARTAFLASLGRLRAVTAFLAGPPGRAAALLRQTGCTPADAGPV